MQAALDAETAEKWGILNLEKPTTIFREHPKIQKNTALSTVGQNEPDKTKDAHQHRKEKKKTKANHANKSKHTGIANFYA